METSRIRRRISRRVMLALSALLFTTAVAAQTDERWVHHGQVMEGVQFDAARLGDQQIVVFGRRTLILDPTGRVIVDEPYGDERQDAMDMPPAASVDQTGGVHTVSRVGGDWHTGHTIVYRYRDQAGRWGDPVRVSGPLKRNYSVAIAGLGPGHALIAVPEAGDNVWGQVHVFEIRDRGGEEPEARLLGSISGIWRSDNRIEMALADGVVYLAAGANDPDGKTSLLWTAPAEHTGTETDLIDALKASRIDLRPDADAPRRRGFPSISPWGSGVDLVMGTQTGRLYWTHSSPGRPADARTMQRVFADLGEWHLSIGRGAAARGADGSTVLVLGLRSDGDKLGNGELVARFSDDGGATFGPAMLIHANVAGGEGRTRIEAIPLDDGFAVLYPAQGGVHLSRFKPAAAPR